MPPGAVTIVLIRWPSCRMWGRPGSGGAVRAPPPGCWRALPPSTYRNSTSSKREVMPPPDAAASNAGRDATGGLLASAGRVPALDTIVGGFSAASKRDQEAMLADVVAAKASLTGDNAVLAEHYVKSMTRVIEKGAAWLVTEAARLSHTTWITT